MLYGSHSLDRRITFLLKLKNSSATFQSIPKRPPNNFTLTERTQFMPLAPIPAATRRTNRYTTMVALLPSIQGTVPTNGSQTALLVEQGLLDPASSGTSKSLPPSNLSSVSTSKIGLQASFHAQAMKTLWTVHGRKPMLTQQTEFLT